MRANAEPLLCGLIRKAVDLVYPKIELVGMENLPQEPCVIVGNHAQIHGPIITEERLPFDHYTWCASQMMDTSEVADYAFRDFWSEKPKSLQWLFWLLSRIIKHPAVYLMTNARTIPVYRDTRCLSTFRRSMEKLEAGYHLVIFPECPRAYNNILYDFQERFIDLAWMYRKRTGKQLQFVPMYLAPKLKKVIFGQPIAYDPQASRPAERARIKGALMDAITAIACAQPLHTVIPYRNIPKKNYPKNLPCEVCQIEKTDG